MMLPMHFKWSCPFHMTKAWTTQREITSCFCKSKNTKLFTKKIQAIFLSMRIRSLFPTILHLVAEWLPLLAEVFIMRLWLCLDDIWSSSQEGLKDCRPGFIISLCQSFLQTVIHTDAIFLCTPKSSHDQGIKIPGLSASVHQISTEMYLKYEPSWRRHLCMPPLFYERLFLLSSFPTYTRNNTFFITFFNIFLLTLGLELKIYWEQLKGLTYVHVYTHSEHNCMYLVSIWHQSSKLGEKNRIYIIVIKYLSSFSYYSWIFGENTSHIGLTKKLHITPSRKLVIQLSNTKKWSTIDHANAGILLIENVWVCIICVRESSCRKYWV